MCIKVEGQVSFKALYNYMNQLSLLQLHTDKLLRARIFPKSLHNLLIMGFGKKHEKYII